MRFLLLSALLVLPSLAQAQTGTGKCLVEDEIGQVVGKIAYGSFIHPARGTLIEGYKIILRRAECFEFTGHTDQKLRIEITEVQFLRSSGYPRAYWKNHQGNWAAEKLRHQHDCLATNRYRFLHILQQIESGGWLLTPCRNMRFPTR